MTIQLHNCADLFRFQPFEQKIMQLAKVMKLDLEHYEIDHLAIRANTEKTAKDWLTSLLNVGIILNQSEVNGRTIYLIKLFHPEPFLNHQVSIVELPMPKKVYSEEGWEHIEVVMPFLDGENIENWQNRILNTFGWHENPQLTVKLSQPKVEGEQKLNPTIAVRLAHSSQNHSCIKIHPHAIQTIIEV